MSVPTMEDDDTDTQYWSCPVTFIPPNIYEFISLYEYHKNFPGANLPPYEKLSPRFISAMKIYEKSLTSYIREVQNG